MIPSKNHPKWVPFIKGEIHSSFKTASGNMLISRLSRSIEKDSSSANLSKSLTEAYNFFSKFENIFSDELNEIFS
jgi:hypothetical protein